MYRPRCTNHILTADGFIVKVNITLNISRKQKHILLYLSDGTAQLCLIYLFDIDAVNQYLSFLNIKISANQIQNGSFSCSGGAHKSNLFARADDKAHIL